MTATDERNVELSRIKIVLLIVGAMAFVVLGAGLYLLDDAIIRTWSYRYNNPVFVHRSGQLAVVFFGLCTIAGIRKFFDTKPGLVFSKEGLLDNASSVSAGLVPWNEIIGAEVLKIQSTRILIVKVVAPQKYLDRGGPLRRALNRANLSLYGSPVQIPATALKINFDELLKLFSEYVTKYGNKS
jgi:hypothetical protein